MKMRSVVSMRIAKIGYAVISAVFCLAGIFLLLFPETSTSMMVLFLGIAMTVFGIVKLVGYFSRDLYRLAFQYDLQFGILWLALGIAALIRPDNVVDFLGVSLGICAVTDCLFKGKVAWEAKSFGLRSWWLIFLLAIPAGLIGLLLLLCPAKAVQAMTMLLGLSLFAQGVLNLCTAVTMVKIVKNQMPDHIEPEFWDVTEKL